MTHETTPFPDLLTNQGTVKIQTGKIAGKEVRFYASVISSDELALRLSAFAIEFDEPDGVSPEVVGRRLCERLNYLSEALDLIEYDELASVATLRSKAEAVAEQKLFYEVVVADDRIDIRRYDPVDGVHRKLVNFDLTKDVYQRLCNDLAAVLVKDH